MTMTKRPEKHKLSQLDRPDEVFEKAAELFRVMSAPMRLKIISSLCEGEQNVSYLLGKIATTQPNMSQHLTVLYQAGVLAKRRDGVQIYYRVVDERIADLCCAMCARIESDFVTG
jgi:ArsR family transcriptional regulator